GQSRLALAVRQAEVCDPQMAAAIDQQIGGFYVAGDYSHVMRVLQRFGRLDAELSNGAKARPAAPRALRGGCGFRRPGIRGEIVRERSVGCSLDADLCSAP